MGIITITLIGLIYLFTFTISLLATSQEILNMSEQESLKMELVRDIVLCVFGGNTDLSIKPIMVLGQMGVMVMIFCHIPFIFYIGKEHILQSIDEHYNFSLSQMVDRIKHRFKGDPRHFLVEKQFKEIDVKLEASDV